MNINSNRNQTNFTSLIGIRYKRNFAPKKCAEDAKALLAFKESEPIKKFFNKYDGYAKFSAGSEDIYDFGYFFKPNANLEIYYNPKPLGAKKNVFSVLKDKIKLLLFPSAAEKYSHRFSITTENETKELAVKDLAKRIKNINYSDMVNHDKNRW